MEKLEHLLGNMRDLKMEIHSVLWESLLVPWMECDLDRHLDKLKAIQLEQMMEQLAK